MDSLNDNIFYLTNSLWEIHQKLNKPVDGEPLDPDLLRGLRAAADYIRHSLWVHDEHREKLSGKSLEEILMTQRLKRATEMLEAALNDRESVKFCSEDLAHLEKIRTLTATQS
jgi:hypothetical protein